jgi:hypothetical protein
MAVGGVLARPKHYPDWKQHHRSTAMTMAKPLR